MADLLLLSLLDDEAVARPLAGVFQRGGLNVVGGHGRPEEFARARAIVVLWTPASAAKQAFRAMADGAVKTGKAAFASTAHSPAPLGAPCYDLRLWRGDPDDPLLDGLFADIDRRLLQASPAGAGVVKAARPVRAQSRADPGAPMAALSLAPPRAPPPEPAPARSARPAHPLLEDAPARADSGGREDPRLRRRGLPILGMLAAGLLAAGAGAAIAWRDGPEQSRGDPAVADAIVTRSPDPMYGPPGDVGSGGAGERVQLSASGPPAAPSPSRRPAPAPAGPPASPAPPPADDDRAAYRGEVIWRVQPGAGLLGALRPTRARNDVTGLVVLDCVIAPALDARCRVVSERPSGQGFAAAALEATEVLLAEPRTTTGASSPGVRARLELAFPPPQES